MKSLFQVPQRVHNAVLLMADLAEHGDGGFVSLTEVAERKGLSRGFLEEVAAPLREADLISAKRGAYGGYVLTRDPADITVRQIIEAIEGPLTLVDCLGGGECPMSGSCSSKNLWSQVQERVVDSLEDMTLAELV
jgi:Rrf2 family protein